MTKKYIIKMLPEEVDALLYMIDEEVGRRGADSLYGLGDLIRRIELVKSGQFEEFLEE